MSIKAVAGTVAGAAGGAALSSFFDKLFDYLSSSDLLKTFRKENFDADLKKWKRMLLKIRAVLDDAEEKQVTSLSVKFWLADLEDLAYDVDDILDEFATEALRRELNPETKSEIPKVLGDDVGSNRDFVKLMRSKIEGINRRLQEIVEEKKELELRENTGGRTITTTSRPPSTSLVNESRTYGRDEDKKEMVKLLLESSDAQLSVIPIVGMGGLGKTTLAQLVYKDDEVSRYFDLKAWVCVSEDFDNLRLTKEILHSFTSESWDNNSTLDSLQVKLKEKLYGKKFLLILDDVWNEDVLWTELRKPFESGALGSKIVFTTRNFDVASTMGTTPPYKLEELSCDACLRVFTHHALDATDFSKYPELEEFGQKIVNRCKGVPLAAKVLGGLLRTARKRNEWEHVLNSKILDIPEEKGKIFSVLKLSYNYLPSHLKRCFAYCSLFPKDDEFEEKDLVLLWKAEGLVQETKRMKSMEDLGGDYFRDLLNRSFFQQSSSNESLFVMHDLMNDLAMWAAGDLCCRLEDQSGGSKQSEISTKVRHFSYIAHSSDCIPKFDEDVHLRTFLSLPLYNRHGLTNSDVKYCLFPQLRCLRVLSLSGNDIFELSSSIGDLKHLRYLNLSHTKIKSLPESTSSLYNLQTLILKGCDYLAKLPEKIENLINLRHLNISNAHSIREMPAGIAKLKSLRTLCFEHMGEWQDWIPCRVEYEEFPCLWELSISNCPKLEGKFPHHLPSLKKLSIDECEQLVVSIPSHSVLQALKIVGCKEVVVHGSLKVEKLIIENCKEMTCFCEDGLMSFVTLEIKIKSCQSLVNIKLKSTLRTLKIEGCDALESLQFVMDEGGASSTSSLLMNEENLSCIGNNNVFLLEHLEISDCPSLKCVSTIVDPSAMLKRLEIGRCPNLTSLSSKDILPTTLKVLHVANCPELELIVDELHKDTLLEVLHIHHCEKLRRLPRGLHELCHLKEIYLNQFDSNFISFPEEGFHTNLRELVVSGPNLCKQIFELGLYRLTSLTSLLIRDGIMYSFPEEEDGKTMLMLPTSLTILEFYNFPNLLFLSWKFFQNLSALKQISIGCCPKLKILSEKCFPRSLQRLEISDCRVLKHNCEKGKGIMWSKIAYIPSVKIDGTETNSSLPMTQGATAEECSLPITEDTAATESSVPMTQGATAAESSLPMTQGATAEECSLPITEDTAVTESSVPMTQGATAAESSLPMTQGATAEECSLPITEDTAVTESSVPMTQGATAAESSLPMTQGATAEECSLPITEDTAATEFSVPMTQGATAAESSLPMTQGTATVEYSLAMTQAATESSLPMTQGAAESSLPTTETPNIRNEADVPINTQSNQDSLQDLFSFKSLKVSEISQLRKLPMGLHSLKIEGCDALEFIPEQVMVCNPPIQRLYIISCCSLKFFSGGSPPTALKFLYIQNCKKLEFLPLAEKTHHYALLEHLCIGSSCDSLVVLPLDLFPKLKILSIWDCANLESFSMPGRIQKDLTSLEALEIRDCPNLLSFPKGGLLTPNLKSIWFSNCKNLKELPDQLHTLSSLRSMFINNCPELLSFPEGGLPSNLSLLCITFCDKMMLGMEWGLNRLDYLSRLEIEGACKNVVSFPEAKLLPRNLNSLRISGLLNLKYLNYRGLQHLTALKILEISCCNKLQSLPEEGLPASLSFLCIKECSLLKPKLQDKTGKDWSKIAHISCIEIDEEVSHEEV